MNKYESKYFNTALRMDEAFISLLEKKDMEYISVKEICEEAGVNRSTFYLHYDTISDLVNETIEMVNSKFISYFSKKNTEIFSRLKDQKLNSLVLITGDYLLPYLKFVRENKKIYRAAFRNPNGMQSHTRYDSLKKYILVPILERFNIPANQHKYYIAYYIEGITAIVKEWLNLDCKDDINIISSIIINCVRPYDYDNKE